MTLREATEGRKLRALPPRWGEGRGPWKGHEWSLRDAEKRFRDSRPVSRWRWSAKTPASETFANALAQRWSALRSALLDYTEDPAFVARATGDAWQFSEAQELAAQRAGEEDAAA